MKLATRPGVGAAVLSALTCGAGVGWLQYRAASTDPWPDTTTYSGTSLLWFGLLAFAAPMVLVTFATVRRAPVTLGWAGVVNVATAVWVATASLGNLIGVAFPEAAFVGAAAMWAAVGAAVWYGRRLRTPHL